MVSRGWRTFTTYYTFHSRKVERNSKTGNKTLRVFVQIQQFYEIGIKMRDYLYRSCKCFAHGT